MTTTTQFKTLFLLVVLFIAGSLAAGPCKPGYVEVEDCLLKAVDPAGGNCWWGYDTGNCVELLGASSATQCADWCYSCLKCAYDYGCCYEGDPRLYQACFSQCLAYMV